MAFNIPLTVQVVLTIMEISMNLTLNGRPNLKRVSVGTWESSVVPGFGTYLAAPSHLNPPLKPPLKSTTMTLELSLRIMSESLKEPSIDEEPATPEVSNQPDSSDSPEVITDDSHESAEDRE
ncbi:uncharacterized protein si:ch73-288o11.5 isoform X2 [Megalobrama amblycephala]|uniref:uncharacterized protein si:ch73-288o11.5 isoform X2 n=1 Tax=Megalobrama amblycephala TaxID=75352 RepID=UPI0020142D4A|nr:uncharacterized protein si:ch73-288o11.5 isoform X2 [Megalobrama amblycephala]